MPVHRNSGEFNVPDANSVRPDVLAGRILNCNANKIRSTRKGETITAYSPESYSEVCMKKLAKSLKEQALTYGLAVVDISRTKITLKKIA